MSISLVLMTYSETSDGSGHLIALVTKLAVLIRGFLLRECS